ncbi:HEPN domain-containing protein [candidate division WOR-3 bacterium]|nr:HEPN domain-containing protein [candidate division WOR-3 bacterium]
MVCATNLAFAIELYLKALLILLDLKWPYTHDLHTLYNLVPESVRELIESVYETFLPDQQR